MAKVTMLVVVLVVTEPMTNTVILLQAKEGTVRITNLMYTLDVVVQLVVVEHILQEVVNTVILYINIYSIIIIKQEEVLEFMELVQVVVLIIVVVKVVHMAWMHIMDLRTGTLTQSWI